ncbi:MAG TPA: cell division protein ZapA [Spirochaetia bacterium]|nr:cell division protein ZapA [Spirochaetales bacterium]HRY73740.1 cell division protein ZapA [Spirochaetia bacterium]
MPVQLISIEVLGASFSVQTDETREYMETLLAELERRLDALRKATKVADPLKLAILANITLLDELARARRETGGGQASEELGRIAERLIGRLDEGLAASGAGDGASVAGAVPGAASSAAQEGAEPSNPVSPV